MAPDGNLVVCNSTNASASGSYEGVQWASNTAGNPGAYALMEEIGVLAVYPRNSSSGRSSSSGDPGPDPRLWQSHTMAAAGCNSTSVNCSFVRMQVRRWARTGARDALHCALHKRGAVTDGSRSFLAIEPFCVAHPFLNPA